MDDDTGLKITVQVTFNGTEFHRKIYELVQKTGSKNWFKKHTDRIKIICPIFV
jgi:hypothetical protein